MAAAAVASIQPLIRNRGMSAAAICAALLHALACTTKSTLKHTQKHSSMSHSAAI